MKQDTTASDGRGITSQKRIDITPYIAAAIARNALCARKLHAQYRINRAACHAAARSSKHYRHPAIATGRAEFEINARRALGVLITASSNADILPIIRAGWRNLVASVDRLPEGGAVPIIDVVPHNAREYTDNAFFDMLVIAMMLTSLTGRHASDDKGSAEAMSMFEEHTRVLERRHDQQFRPERLDKADHASARILFQNATLPGMTGLTDAFGDQTYEAVEAMLDGLNFSIHDYCDGIELRKSDRAICAHFSDGSTERVPMLALFCMLTRAIQQDRAFCMDAFRDDKDAQIDVANAEATAARESLRVAEEQISTLKSAIERQEAELRRATSELHDHDGDARELAALRNALYAAQSSDEENAPTGAEPRALPDGIVCLGGRQTWLNHMRTRFPSVKFIGPDSSFNDSELRNASEIWFSPSYISHAQYYRAIGIARAHNVTVRYFSSSGADRSEIEMLT